MAKCPLIVMWLAMPSLMVLKKVNPPWTSLWLLVMGAEMRCACVLGCATLVGDDPSRPTGGSVRKGGPRSGP